MLQYIRKASTKGQLQMDHFTAFLRLVRKGQRSIKTAFYPVIDQMIQTDASLHKTEMNGLQ